MHVPTYFDLKILALEGFFTTFKYQFENLRQIYTLRSDQFDICYSNIVEYAMQDALRMACPNAKLLWQYQRHDLYEIIQTAHFPYLAQNLYAIADLKRQSITALTPVKLMVLGNSAILAIGRQVYGARISNIGGSA